MPPPKAGQPVQAVKMLSKTFRELHGVVVSAGLMDKTVKVRVGGQKWNSWLKKFFDDPQTHLVHDPANSLRTGDVVAITPGFRVSRHKRHLVKHIIAPGSGVPIGARAPVPPLSELQSALEAARADKDARRAVSKAAERVERAVGVAEGVLKMARGMVARRAGALGMENGGVVAGDGEGAARTQ